MSNIVKHFFLFPELWKRQSLRPQNNRLGITLCDFSFSWFLLCENANAMSTFIASNAMKWGKKRDKTLRATCVCLQMVSKCDICSICRRKHLHIYISYAFCPKLYSTTVSEICLAECNIVCNMNFQLRFVTLSHKIVFQCVESFLAYQTCNVALRSSRTLNGKTWKKIVLEILLMVGSALRKPEGFPCGLWCPFCLSWPRIMFSKHVC